jgi:general secretion pathway protein I
MSPNSDSPASNRPAGFTLLEVIVALVIAALALIVMFRSGSDGLLAVDVAGRAEQAALRAQSHLAAVGNDVALLQGVTEGDDGGGYHWRLRIEPAAQWKVQPNIGAPPIGTTLYDVEVAITWPGGAHNRAVVLKTERLGTASSGR